MFAIKILDVIGLLGSARGRADSQAICGEHSLWRISAALYSLRSQRRSAYVNNLERLNCLLQHQLTKVAPVQA